MDKKIDDLKNYYLNTPPPMPVGEGFSDVLIRLEKKPKSTNMRFVFVGFAVFLFALLSTAFLLPESTISKAVKQTGFNVLNVFSNPTPTPNVSQTLENIQRKQNPSLTPTMTPKPTIKPSSETKPQNNGQSVSEQKRSQNPSQNVQGISDIKKEENMPATPNNESGGNSEDHRQNNQQNQGSDNANDKSQNNPSSQNSKGKNN